MPYNFDQKARVPVRPLSFEDIALAVPKEFVIDYKNCAAYIVAEDGNYYNVFASPDTLNIVVDYLVENPDMITNVKFTKIDGEEITIKAAFNEIYESIDSMLDHIKNHKYAGSKIDGGSALSAEKVDNALKIITSTYLDDGSSSTQSTTYDGSAAIEAKLAPADHKHKYAVSDVVDGSALSAKKVNNALIINVYDDNDNSTEAYSYDGSEEKTIPELSKKDHMHSNYLDKETGGTIDGDVIFGKKIILSADCYGNEVPDEGVEGQLFFKLLEDE